MIYTVMDILNKLQEKNIILRNLKINKQASRLLKNNPILLSHLHLETTFLSEDVDNIQRLHCIIHNITSHPLCKNCSKPTTFNKSKRTFNNFCANKNGVNCSAVDKDVVKKKKKTMVERYGVENPTQSKKIQDKIKKTNLERYGVESPAQSNVIKEKTKQTNLERYGVENPMQNSIFKIKARKTLKDKYGVEYFSQNHISPYTLNFLNDKVWLHNQHIEQKRTLTCIAKELEVSKATISKYMYRHGIPVENYPLTSNISRQEKEILEYIKKNYTGKILTNKRNIISPYELDIYIPEYNLAIEYDGIFWHSELNGKGKYYHLNKTKKCEEVGIQLIHIWSREWEEKQNIVKARITSMFKQNIRIYARKCVIREIDYTASKEFLKTTHIQSFCNSSINIGLFYGDELVSVMTFGKPRYDKNYEYELIRFSSLLNHTIVGGASKLFYHFIKTYNPNSVITYSDKRWGTGEVYKKLKFTSNGASPPNFFYFSWHGDSNKLYSRIKFQKHKLNDVLEFYNPKLSVWQNMIDNGYDRIWDCGNEIYSYLK